MTCVDMETDCDYWANTQKLCTGKYEEYMTINCPYSCNTCPGESFTRTT